MAVCGQGPLDSVNDFGAPLFSTFPSSEIDTLPDRVANFDGGEIPASRTIIHAWTPRERTRLWTQRLLSVLACKYVVHLEDNETALACAQLQLDKRALIQFAKSRPEAFPVSLSHPVLSRRFLAEADGCSVIVDRLREFVPEHVPVQLLEPGVDAELFSPARSQLEREELARSLGLDEREQICVYHGNMHAANRREMFSLYTAILILQRRGFPVRLLRCGADFCDALDVSSSELQKIVTELGVVPRTRLIEILRLATFYVQPGGINSFNAYRLPSKLPEFLALGRPVILPRTNLGLRLRHGQEALLMERGDALDIAESAQIVLRHSSIGDSIGEAGRAFAVREMNWSTNARRLERFYMALVRGRFAAQGHVERTSVP